QIRFRCGAQADVRCRESRIDFNHAIAAAVLRITQDEIDANISPRLRQRGNGGRCEMAGAPIERWTGREPAAEILELTVTRQPLLTRRQSVIPGRTAENRDASGLSWNKFLTTQRLVDSLREI